MTTFVLASQSAGRRMVLENAGLEFTCASPQVDEESIRKAFLAAGRKDHGALALELARAKTLAVARDHDPPVLGGDQLLVCEERIFSKPATIEEARANLQALRGKTHHLISAMAVAKNDTIVFEYVDRAAMTMRRFSDAFLDGYLDTMGKKVLRSVGGYQIEGLGVQLFDHIDGDWQTIIGLPLLPFLHWLREEGLLLS
ncbi:MAG TPA: hypothetical protein ENK15_01360 [Thermopetrobacter sp.]|nr:hypothetical protein [Thermopetrobacter sp.]